MKNLIKFGAPILVGGILVGMCRASFNKSMEANKDKYEAEHQRSLECTKAWDELVSMGHPDTFADRLGYIAECMKEQK